MFIPSSSLLMIGEYFSYCTVLSHKLLTRFFCSMAIIGSANINQRSLAGSRDSEIAVSCLQPEHTLLANDGKLPEGDVAYFRMRLFEEHLGCQDLVLKKPRSQLCATFIKDICAKNWKVDTRTY